MMAGLKTNRLFKSSTGIPDIAAYFLRKEYMIVRVVIISTLVSSRILWKAPASWSAWQWLIMIARTITGGIPIYFKW